MHDQEGDRIEDRGDLRSCVSLTMEMEDMGLFFPILQIGVKIPARVECTLHNLLHEQLGLDTAFVSERVTTIFLDGRPTDRLEDVNVKNGSTIALSAAMPGVVGATMRRGSYYAAMRHDITSSPCGELGSRTKGSVTVKLFNLLLHDLGPFFLARGIVANLCELAQLFKGLPKHALQRCNDVEIDGRGAGPESLRDLDARLLGSEVTLIVRFKKNTV